jgi:hypothetical protein
VFCRDSSDTRAAQTATTVISAFRQTSAALSGLTGSCLSCAAVVASTSFGLSQSSINNGNNGNGNAAWTAASVDLPASALPQARLATKANKYREYFHYYSFQLLAQSAFLASRICNIITAFQESCEFCVSATPICC